ncbi:MOSC domain-containing protein [Oceanicella actignis]|uniref:MOSC domain-containing protein n=1 Tax=Oceanicella actignis TaxID=1189325 RepID=A0A1M7T1I8_9RHOB|nr:MOSC domain-containing protein [Oceanicella actignis]TYO88908.1 MOSC domain-containing protein [Oceanicella actignis]SET37663.1 MOSC domain-containing protein [Oceanicella actignis]SHN64522.1 MOSC domain-containing protein [Oceanicella actignis]
MPILSPTSIAGRVAFLGVVRDRRVTLRSEPLTAVEATFEGFAGECHGGLTRPSCSRVAAQYPKGTEIRNARQVSILSVEELADIAARMGLEALRPEWLGANLVLEGIPDLTLLPPSSRLIFASGASIVVDMENGPCQFPAQEIERERPGKGKGFKPAAEGRRGLVGWVERPGPIALGDEVRLHVPPLRLYPHLPAQAGAAADQP